MNLLLCALVVPQSIPLADLKPTTTDATLLLQVSVSAPEGQELESVHVWDNNVPVFGRKGFAIPRAAGSDPKKWSGDLPRFALETGENKLEVAVRTKSGVFSLRTPPRYVRYTPMGSPRQRHLRVVAVGVNLPAFSPLEKLQTAERGAFRIHQVLTANHGRLFASASVPGLKPLTGPRATRAAILATKRYLLQTSPDDTVVIFLSGHGEQRRGQFYFMTHNYDATAPERTGLSYNDILDLLGGIPARRRLVLIDACNSGPTAPAVPSPRIVAGRGGGARNPFSDPTKAPPSFELMLDIFADLNRSEGAEVIGATTGYASAFDPGTQGGTWFAAALIEALRRPQVAGGRSGLTVGQLREYVRRRVRALSQGAQIPSERETNLEGGGWRIR